MFIYHYRVKNWLVYSCPGRVILISRVSLRKSTAAISFIKHEHPRFGRTIQVRQIKIYGDLIKRKKLTIKYITPILGKIVDNQYRIISEYTTNYDNSRDELLQDWEEKILVDVGFYE
jgi:hypothetical protein